MLQQNVKYGSPLHFLWRALQLKLNPDSLSFSVMSSYVSNKDILDMISKSDQTIIFFSASSYCNTYKLQTRVNLEFT